MVKPEDTSKRDPLLHLAGMWPRIGSQESDDYITGMEADGQRQLVSSDRLPTDLGIFTRNDPEAYQAAREKYEQLGFTFGEPDPDDPLFCPATLPAGWRREGSDHAMWSYIVDDRGLRRVAVFYKAAFYDRGAHMTILNVGAELASQWIYADEPEPIPWDKLTGAEVAEVRGRAEKHLRVAEEFPRIYGDRAGQARELLRKAEEGSDG